MLGVQAVGPGEVVKRIDTAVAAITFRGTAEQLAQVDLAYAPPFSSAMDNQVVAGDIMKNRLSPAEHREVRIAGARLIPLGMLRERLGELPPGKKIIAFCKISLRGYEAQRILDAAGFESMRFLDGGILAWPYELERDLVA